MLTAEIHTRFLDFFTARGHTAVPSAPLPTPDPTLLFVNAGMVPFKPYLTGDVPPPWPRATSVQKCVRTLDIEEVGRTTRHGTFFQMCGNFSFGDYFKQEAISYAWELSTAPAGEGGFGLDPDRIWVTVHHSDTDARGMWRQVAGLPDGRIVARGDEDNFWSMGVPGPCGPCSELYYDRGPAFGRDGGPAVDEDRFMEFWNLVFMQYERGPGAEKSEYPVLGELPRRNIDTGLGLERMATLLQGVDTLYETDQTRPVLERAAQLAVVGARGATAVVVVAANRAAVAAGLSAVDVVRGLLGGRGGGSGEVAQGGGVPVAELDALLGSVPARVQDVLSSLR